MINGKTPEHASSPEPESEQPSQSRDDVALDLSDIDFDAVFDAMQDQATAKPDQLSKPSAQDIENMRNRVQRMDHALIGRSVGDTRSPAEVAQLRESLRDIRQDIEGLQKHVAALDQEDLSRSQQIAILAKHDPKNSMIGDLSNEQKNVRAKIIVAYQHMQELIRQIVMLEEKVFPSVRDQTA